MKKSSGVEINNVNVVEKDMVILLVEDDRLMRKVMSDRLLAEGYKVLEAGDGNEAKNTLQESVPDLIITDLIMPEMDGFQFIRWVRDRYFDIPVIVVSGREDFEAIHSIVSLWVYDYHVKPFDLNDLVQSVKGAIEKILVSRREQDYIKSLEMEVKAQIEKNRFFFYEAVQSLVNALEAKDQYTQGHSLRVTRLAHQFSKSLDTSDKVRDQISLAGQLHDIGKLAISDQILNKEGRLTNDEYEIIKQHPVASHKILKPILRDASLDAVLYHHERWDGKGYPLGLAGENSPYAARIISIADSFDAMTSERAYRKNMTADEACGEIEQCSGAQFDPELVPYFVEMIRES